MFQKRFAALTPVILLVLLVMLFGPGAAGARAAKSYSAERFDVTWTVNEDGSMDITETVVFRFAGGPFTFVYRELPGAYSDGVQDIRAWMDGQALGQGERAGQVEIENDDPLRVTWHFAPTSDAAHTFVLAYRMLGVVQQAEDADLLAWNVLPTEYEYYIASATLRARYPADAGLLGAPEITRGRAELRVEDGDEIVLTAADLAPHTPLTLAMRFEPGSLISSPPQWQRRHAAALASAPYFVAAALALLLLGGTAVVFAWRRLDRPPRFPVAPQYDPPSDLPPALAGALRGAGTQVGWPQALAALFDLGRRGVLSIEQAAPRRWQRQGEFSVVLLDAGGAAQEDLRPHESTLLDIIFDGGNRDRATLAEVARRFGRRSKKFSRAVKDELAAAGLLSPERDRARNRLMAAGIGLLLLAAVGGAVAAMLVSRFEAAPLLLPAALFAVSLLAIVLAAVYAPLTDEGAEETALWKGFYQHMKAVTGEREAWDASVFERYLPLAAGFDMAESWAKAYKKQGGVEAPAWFHTLAGAPGDNIAYFVVLMSASHAAGSSGGGAGSGGAGGGGGSGAG